MLPVTERHGLPVHNSKLAVSTACSLSWFGANMKGSHRCESRQKPFSSAMCRWVARVPSSALSRVCSAMTLLAPGFRPVFSRLITVPSRDSRADVPSSDANCRSRARACIIVNIHSSTSVTPPSMLNAAAITPRTRALSVVGPVGGPCSAGAGVGSPGPQGPRDGASEPGQAPVPWNSESRKRAHAVRARRSTYF